MKGFSRNSPNVVRFANGMLAALEPGCVWTMTIRREKSGGSSVLIAIDELSDDTAENLVERSFSVTPLNT
jgi:hypothetical protein